MSDTSINMSNESPEMSPTAHAVPLPVSPRTVDNILHGPASIDAATLRGIASGLVGTIKEWEIKYQGEHHALHTRIDHLEGRLKHYQEIFDTAPEGYVENDDKVPGFSIPYGDGLYLPAKWVKQLNDGRITGYTARDGPSDQPFITEPYATPSYNYEDLATPLPFWYMHLLNGPSTKFAALREATAAEDDWGLFGEVLRYRELNDHIILCQNQLHVLEQEIEALRENREMSQFQLEGARAHRRVSHLQRMSVQEHGGKGGWKKTASAKTVRGRPV